MSRNLLFAALMVFLAAPALLGQPPNLPPQPVPVAPQPGPLPPVPLTPQPQPGMLPPIAVPPGNPLPPPATPIFVPATPLFLDDPRPVANPPRIASPNAGFYGMLEISLLYPDLHGWLSGPVVVQGVPQNVTLSSAGLDGTGSPQVEIGYRLGDGLGAVAVKYRSIVSQGSENIANFDALGDGFLSSRLDVNVLDIDYASPGYDIAPLWGFAWRAGIRTAGVYFDHQATGSFVQLHTSSNFVGAGPHAQLEVARALDLIPGLAVVSKLDGALLIGNVSQSFEETLHFPQQEFGGASHFDHTQTVPVLTFDLGLTYTPRCCNWARFGFGYQFEYWWDIGNSGNSRGDLGANSLYFRGEFNF